MRKTKIFTLLFIIIIAELSLFYLVRLYYDQIQLKHQKTTSLSMEKIIKLIDTKQIIRARNSKLHNIYDCDNYKFVSRDGKYEYILKADIDDKGKMIYKKQVTSPINRGTYNFFNQEGNFFERKLHKIDVFLWILYGTGKDDPSTIIERIYFRQNHPNACQNE